MHRCGRSGLEVERDRTMEALAKAQLAAEEERTRDKGEHGRGRRMKQGLIETENVELA